MEETQVAGGHPLQVLGAAPAWPPRRGQWGLARPGSVGGGPRVGSARPPSGYSGPGCRRWRLCPVEKREAEMPEPAAT